MKNRRGSLAKILTKEFLHTEHYINKKTINKIASEVGCNEKSVSNYLNMYGLVVQTYDVWHPYRKRPKWKGHEDISMTFWNNVIRGAKSREIIFKLTIEKAWKLYIKQKRRCALSGRNIGFEYSKSNTASLDRIDSTKGYTINNIQWVHRDLNFSKQSLSNEEFINLCREVVTYANK